MISSLLFLFCLHAQAEHRIPFEYCDGLIWIKIKTPAAPAPLNFLLDSGAGASVLDLSTAHRLGVKLAGRETVRRVGAHMSAWRARGFDANLAGIRVSECPLVLDLRDTSDECSRPIQGLIGEDFFRGRIVDINFKTHCIRLLNNADVRNCCAVMPLRLQNAAMCVPISVNGSTPLWIRLDTGCDGGLHWVVGKAGGSASVSLKLGDERIENVETALHRSAIFPSEDGLIGNGILSNYRVTIDGINRRLILQRT